jgi:hypothetical protein
MRAELEFHRIVVSNVAAERAEDVGNWRIGSAEVTVCGGCLPAVRLYSNSPCGDKAAHHWGCCHKTLVSARAQGVRLNRMPLKRNRTPQPLSPWSSH